MKNLNNLSEKFISQTKRLKHYLPILFCLLLVLVYGFIAYRSNVLNQAEPTAGAATLQARTSQVPRIDPTVVSQLQNLQDNSVSVKALFDQARSNPFQE